MYFHVSLLMLSWYFNLLITLKRGISWLFLTNKWLDFFSVCFHFSSSHMPVICSLFLDVRNIKHGTYTCLLLCSLSVTSSAFHHSRVCKRQDSQVQMIQRSLESLWAPSQLVPSTALKVVASTAATTTKSWNVCQTPPISDHPNAIFYF